MRAVTLAELRDGVRRAGEWTDAWLTPAILDPWINASIAGLYDMLADADPKRYRSTDSIAVVAGTAEYNLETETPDFYRLTGVEVADSSVSSGWRTMERCNWDERNEEWSTDKADARYIVAGSKLLIVPTPEWSANVRLNYSPAATKLEDAGDSFDSVNDWTQWVIWDCAVKAALAEGTDARGFMAERERFELKITGKRARVDHAKPETVTDVTGRFGGGPRYGRYRRRY